MFFIIYFEHNFFEGVLKLDDNDQCMLKYLFQYGKIIILSANAGNITTILPAGISHLNVDEFKLAGSISAAKILEPLDDLKKNNPMGVFK